MKGPGGGLPGPGGGIPGGGGPKIGPPGGGIPGGGPKIGPPGGGLPGGGPPKIGPGGGGPASLFGKAGKGGPPKMTPPKGGPLDAALKNVRGKMGPDFAKAKTPGEKADLSKKLTDFAGSAKNDPPSQLAAFQEAIRTGIESGDVTQVFSAIEAACRIFDLDEYAEKSRALKEILGGGGEYSQALAGSAYSAARQAASYDDYENAKELAESAYDAYGKSGDAEKQSETDELKQYLAAAAQELANARIAEKTVESKPDDPEANLTIGRYLALVKEDWDRGLPYLAKGGDGPLATAARADLAAAQQGPDAQSSIADTWWGEGEQEKDKHEAHSMLRRGGYWYGKTLGSLAGASRAKAEKRIAVLKTLK